MIFFYTPSLHIYYLLLNRFGKYFPVSWESCCDSKGVRFYNIFVHVNKGRITNV